MTGDDWSAIYILFLFVGAYLFPSIVAIKRHHNNGAAIFGLNIFLGWTFLGWVAAFVWALTDNVEKRETAKN